MADKATFFVITPPIGEGGREWAKANWDTYGFDYLIEKTHETVLAWTLSTDKELAAALKSDEIEFETFVGDTERVVG